jgi:hypothetical protein
MVAAMRVKSPFSQRAWFGLGAEDGVELGVEVEVELGVEVEVVGALAVMAAVSFIVRVGLRVPRSMHSPGNGRAAPGGRSAIFRG